MSGAFDGLLEPIPGDAPAGETLRWGPLWTEIEEARRDEGDDMPRGVWTRELKRADHGRVVALCRRAMTERSKDLQAACWLVEAATRRDGPGAIAEGLRFLSDFCAAWWDRMHPEHDGESDSPRFAPLVWLDSALALALATAPLVTVESDGGPRPLSWSDHAAAQRREAAKRGAKQAKAARDWATTALFDEAADRTPLPALLSLRDACAEAADAAAALEQALRDLAGDDAPGFGRLRAAAEDVGALLTPLIARRPPPEPAPTRSEALAAEVAKMSDAIEPAPKAAAPAAPTDRDQAYAALARIAAFLRRTEPHSLTPYLLDRAVRWGGMSAGEVMADLSRGGRDPEMLAWLLQGSGKNAP
jgi:type VI secretion system ImpA family protein